MTHTITVKHTFETGHRLPHLEGKCENLHGHSWAVAVEVYGPVHEGILIEFGALKYDLRTWIDSRLDHGLMLGAADPLVPILAHYGKTFIFGEGEHTEGLYWPTVENVATLLARVASSIVAEIDPACRVSSVTVTETSVNQATYHPLADIAPA